MISDSPFRGRSSHPATGPDRFVGSFSELSDDEFLRRTAIGLRREARNAEADRLDKIADRIAALRDLVKEP